MKKESDIIEHRRKKLEELKKKQINLFPNDFSVSHNIVNILDILEKSPEAVTEKEPVFSVAGRIMAINRFGKSSFIRFRDATGQLQVYQKGYYRRRCICAL